MNSAYSNGSIANTTTDVENSHIESYKIVSEVIGLPVNGNWEILDETDGLALVHYREDANMTTYGHLRGVLIDLRERRVIADSFGYTPTVVASTLTHIDGTMSLVDVKDVVHEFPEGETFVKRAFEGVVIRVIRHNGNVYRITHRKIKPTRSRWGNSPFFMDMYVAAGGPTDEQLFDMTKKNSTSCYIFLVVHPALLVGTMQKVEQPYIVHLATHELNQDFEDTAPGLAKFDESGPENLGATSQITGTVTTSFIHTPQVLSLHEANYHLKYGYYDEFEVQDERQLTGEGCIVYRVIDGEIVDIVKVHSPSYDWRHEMRGCNPNVAHQFYSLVGTTYRDVKDDRDWNEMCKYLIPLPLFDQLSIREFFNQNKMILTFPGALGDRSNYTTREQRLHLLWMNYLLSLPISVQAEGLELLDRFTRERDELVAWIQLLEKKHRDILSVETSDRVKSIIISSRKLAHTQNSKGNNRSQKGAVLSIGILIKKTIRNLLYKEYGTSLYSLISTMKKTKAAEAAAASEAALVVPMADLSV